MSTGSVVLPSAQTAAQRDGRHVWERAIRAKWPLSLTAVVLLLAAWQVIGLVGLLPDYVLSPSEIVGSIVSLSADGTMGPMVATSLYRLAAGFVIGTSAGVLLGLLAGTSRVVSDLVDPGVSFTYPVPKIALMPVIVIWLGFGDASRILIIALGCFFPAYINSASGTRLVDPAFLRIAANAEASRLRTFFAVVLPAALPRVLTGVRISLALSFVVLYAAEIVVDPSGIGGGLIGAGYDNGRYDMMFAGLATLAVLGFVCDFLLGRFAAWATRGRATNAMRAAE